MSRSALPFCAFLLSLCVRSISFGQILAYGVTSDGILFTFDTDLPAVVTELGPVGFTPEAIDFRPGTNTLYAIDIGPNTTQMYTLNINNGAPTAVGAGFASSGVGYDLTGNQSFGFDFNPTTLQADNSMRIRLVSSANENLRLNSSTGLIAAVDGDLAFANGNSPFIDGAAYINNTPTMGGTTALYDMDSRNDALLLQNPPNAGTVATVGGFGVAGDVLSGIGFDIFTTPGNTDPTIGGDFGFAVVRAGSADGTPYSLFDVDLASGALSNPATVGSMGNVYDFTGGFAVLPEPTGWSMLALTLAIVGAMRPRSTGR